MHLANASYRFIHVEKFNKCYDTRMRGEKNGMGEELNKYSKSYHTLHTAQQSHTQIPPSTYIFMNHEIRKKIRWRTCSHNKQRQLRAKMYAYVEGLNNKCWKSHRKNQAKFFKLVIAKWKSLFLNNNFNIRHLASILEICFLFFEKSKKQTSNS